MLIFLIIFIKHNNIRIKNFYYLTIMNFKIFLFLFSGLLTSQQLLSQSTKTAYKPTEKKYHIIGSAGFGFPSVLGYLAYKNSSANLEIIKSTNPFMGKLEYVKKRWGVGATYTTNFQQFHIKYANTNPPLVDNVSFNTWALGVRGNYYLINKPLYYNSYHDNIQDNFQLYIGGGVGYIETVQKTQTIGFPFPPTVTYTFGTYPMSFEATTGARYFINQNVGVFFEAGLGCSPIQLIDKGASDSYLQGGISIRW
jgi:hypothetical protein